MQKVTTLRYSSRCKKCGETIPAGSRAVWLGKGTGVQHESCTAHTEIEKPKEIKGDVDRYIHDYNDLRNDFHRFVGNPMSVYQQERNRNVGQSLVSSWKSKWDDSEWGGCTIPEMEQFIREGYRVAGLDGVTSLIPAKPRRRIRYSEEGDELAIELALAGEDEPFMEWEKRVSKPGLSVEIHMTFDAYYPAKTIVHYQTWIARALQTLDENGVDMEVNLTMPGMYVFDDQPGTRTETMIRVRKAGEASDFSSWSPMFSPGGFRMLGIMGIGIHADRTGHKVASGYGASMDYGSWTVAYDEERNIIVIGNNGNDRVFPEFEMTEKLKAVLAKLNG